MLDVPAKQIVFGRSLNIIYYAKKTKGRGGDDTKGPGGVWIIGVTRMLAPRLIRASSGSGGHDGKKL